MIWFIMFHFLHKAGDKVGTKLNESILIRLGPPSHIGFRYWIFWQLPILSAYCFRGSRCGRDNSVWDVRRLKRMTQFPRAPLPVASLSGLVFMCPWLWGLGGNQTGIILAWNNDTIKESGSIKMNILTQCSIAYLSKEFFFCFFLLAEKGSRVPSALVSPLISSSVAIGYTRLWHLPYTPSWARPLFTTSNVACAPKSTRCRVGPLIFSDMN